MTTGRKNRGSYSTGLATRESILNVAMSLISRRGFAGISLRDIGREVGISHPAVIYHFPSKEALLGSVINRMEERRRKWPDRSGARHSRNAVRLCDRHDEIGEQPGCLDDY